jgi:hypothetical protein
MYLIYTFLTLIISDGCHNYDYFYRVLSLSNVIYLTKLEDAGLIVALIATIFVFSGYWQKVKDQSAGRRFLNSLAYGVSIDALVAPWAH